MYFGGLTQDRADTGLFSGTTYKFSYLLAEAT